MKSNFTEKQSNNLSRLRLRQKLPVEYVGGREGPNEGDTGGSGGGGAADGEPVQPAAIAAIMHSAF